MLKKILSIILLGAGIANADVTPFPGKLELVIPSLPSTLTFEGSEKIELIPAKNFKGIAVRALLVAENEAALKNYLSTWALRASSDSGNFIEVKATPRGGGFSSSYCNQALSNGSYLHLKGVCISKVLVFVPEGTQARIKSDRKTILIDNGLTAPVRAGSIASKETVKSLISELEEASFAPDKQRVLNDFVQNELNTRRQLLTTAQVASILELESFDSDKLRSLRTLKSYISVTSRDDSSILDSFDFDSSKADARRILSGN